MCVHVWCGVGVERVWWYAQAGWLMGNFKRQPSAIMKLTPKYRKNLKSVYFMTLVGIQLLDIYSGFQLVF